MEGRGDFISWDYIKDPGASLPTLDASIDVAIFQILIEAIDPLYLPPFKGSTFRGAFGAALKEVACKTGNGECSSCPEYLVCSYIYIFNTPPPPGAKMMRLYDASPHPFILEPPLDNRCFFDCGDQLLFGLVLVGKGIEYRSLFWEAFDRMGRVGIGKGKGRFKIGWIRPMKGKYAAPNEHMDSKRRGDVIIQKLLINSRSGLGKCGDGPSRVALNFLTPTRIQIEGRPIMDIPFQALVRSMLRRISMIYYFHGGGDPFSWDFRGWIDRATCIKMPESNLQWYDWERYSSRQDTRMTLGGFIGEAEFEGELEPFLPLISAGEILHVGKGTSFGLGKYTLLNGVATRDRSG